MINFDQTLAAHFVTALASGEHPARIESLYSAVKSSSGVNSVKDAIKNCQCDSIRYNDTVIIVERLLDILEQMPFAPVGVLFGTLIPEFFCLGQKAVELSKDNGKASSQLIDESSAEDPSGS